MISGIRTMSGTRKSSLAVLICGASLLGGVQVGHAQGANWAGYPKTTYHASLPARPVGYSTDPATIAAQGQAGSTLKTAIQNAITAGETSYTVSPGVYRFTDSSAVINVLRVSNFTLNAAGCTFIMANPRAYLLSGQHNWNLDHMNAACSDITIQGSDSAPLIVDCDALSKTQGTITAYDPNTGTMQIAVMPGYSTQVNAADNVTAYTSAGMDIPYGYYHSVYGAYTNGQAINSNTVQLTITDPTDRLDASHRYAVGNFVTLPTLNSSSSLLCYFSAVDVTNLTLKNIAGGTGGPLFYTNGCALHGLTQIINVANGPIPGTNRLGVNPFAQTSSPRGSVVMNGCEFGGSYDDAMDIQSSHFNMYLQTLASNQMLVWQIYGGTDYAAGDKVSLFTDKNFAKADTATVTSVAAYTEASPTTTDASNLWNSLGRRSKSGGSLVVLTLNQQVTGATPGDFLENNSNRMTSFTMTNCYWHQVGVRVMIEGVQKGTFSHNTFDGVNGGLALVSDPYWAQGGTCQNVMVSNNVFRNCNLSSTQAVGALVLGPYWGSGPVLAGQDYSFHNYTVTKNTFTGTGVKAISAHMVGTLHISHNLFSSGQGKAIGLYGCGSATVFDNSVVQNNGLAVEMSDDNGGIITQNYLDDTAAPTAPLSAGNSVNVMAINNTLVGAIPIGKTISLKAAANGNYVCADNAGASPLIANRTSVGPWEQYTVLDAGKGNVSLQAHANNLYVSADNAGASPLIASRSTLGLSRTFQWIDLGGGSIGLKSRVDSQYVSAENYGLNPLQADRPAIGQWETFQVTQY